MDEYMDGSNIHVDYRYNILKEISRRIEINRKGWAVEERKDEESVVKKEGKYYLTKQCKVRL